MLPRFMPHEGKFFDLLDAHAEQIVLGAEALKNVLAVLNRSDEESRALCEAIDRIERRADEITHETMRQLHKSFITPFDREEIHLLITNLDGILDLIQDVAHSITLYHIGHVTEEAVKLGDICLECCRRVRSAVGLLPSMDNGPQK